MSRPLDLRPIAGPCAVCGCSGLQGLHGTPSGADVCAACHDDVTGYSTAHDDDLNDHFAGDCKRFELHGVVPTLCWNCDWPNTAGRTECFHCGARLTVRPR